MNSFYQVLEAVGPIIFLSTDTRKLRNEGFLSPFHPRYPDILTNSAHPMVNVTSYDLFVCRYKEALKLGFPSSFFTLIFYYLHLLISRELKIWQMLLLIVNGCCLDIWFVQMSFLESQALTLLWYTTGPSFSSLSDMIIISIIYLCPLRFFVSSYLCMVESWCFDLLDIFPIIWIILLHVCFLCSFQVVMKENLVLTLFRDEVSFIHQLPLMDTFFSWYFSLTSKERSSLF